MAAKFTTSFISADVGLKLQFVYLPKYPYQLTEIKGYQFLKVSVA